MVDYALRAKKLVDLFETLTQKKKVRGHCLRYNRYFHDVVYVSSRVAGPTAYNAFTPMTHVSTHRNILCTVQLHHLFVVATPLLLDATICDAYHCFALFAQV